MKNKFPEDFLWGAATSSHQVEGDNNLNDWWAWEQEERTAPSGKACDHYNRFREDFRIAKELGHNAHRFSIEWSRVEKNEGEWDQAGWDHYRRVADELLKLGITPIVTLNHFTVPAWFARKGSWLSDNSIKLFTRYAVKAIEELGEKVEYWIPFNEPHVLAFLGYYYGDWPPGKTNFNYAITVLGNMLKSHVEAYRVMHDHADKNSRVKRPKIGLAKAVATFHPCAPFSVRDRFVAYLRSKFYNHIFIVSIKKGRMLIPGLPHEKLSMKNALDFIGLNYYFRQFIHYQKPFTKHPFGEVCSTFHHKDAGEITDMGWEVYPRGIYEVVKSFARYRLPIIITENGIATNDDPKRQDYIKTHLKYLLRAIEQGVPLKGYLHWSLLDNFEWDKGYSKRFGLVQVDFDSQKRTIRDSARYYESVIRGDNI